MEERVIKQDGLTRKIQRREKEAQRQAKKAARIKHATFEYLGDTYYLSYDFWESESIGIDDYYMSGHF